MSIVTKRPPIKETVGAQYYCFATKKEGSTEFTGEYEEEIIRTDTVKSVNVSEESENTPIYASGEIYDTVNDAASHSIEVETVAVVAEDLDRMRGDIVSEAGLVYTPTAPERPYFAYGKVVKLRGGNVRYDWYPKCKLVENSDENQTREESFSEQNETQTITAYPFDGKNIKVKYESSSQKLDWMTEEIFFSKVITSDEDLLSLKPTENEEN
ncbi:MAG: phage tail protein [Massilimicrobiota timonensis]